MRSCQYINYGEVCNGNDEKGEQEERETDNWRMI